jgi:type IV pilus assembly protein PilB
MSRQLAELLVKDRIITPAQLSEASEAAKYNKSYTGYFIEKRYLSEAKLLYYLSEKFGLPSVNITKFEIHPEVIKMVPTELVKKCMAIPIQSNKGTLVIAVYDPTNLVASLESIRFVVKMNVEAVLTSYSAFTATMTKYYTGAINVGAAIETYRKDKDKDRDRDKDKGKEKEKDKNAKEGDPTSGLEIVQIHDIESENSESDGPVIQVVNGLLSEAIKRMASDIHVEPFESFLRIRMRVDGILYEVTKIPVDMKRAVIARFKIISRMDISETRIPQDGRIKLRASGKDFDFRVNTLPTLFGEKVVLRMLSKGNLQLDLLKLGFEPKQLESFKKAIYSPNGMVLVTGPTGSGKTTTLYSALAELNKTADNLSTAEDPVEYNLEGINQTQVHKEIGLTFANVLRSLLRWLFKLL